jgi:hypothetical protein
LVLAGALMPNCELVGDLVSLLPVDDSSNVNDQMRFHYCLMIEMTTPFRVNVFRDVNLLTHSWRSNHYGLHATEFIKW